LEHIAASLIFLIIYGAMLPIQMGTEGDPTAATTLKTVIIAEGTVTCINAILRLMLLNYAMMALAPSLNILIMKTIRLKAIYSWAFVQLQKAGAPPVSQH